MDGWVNEWIFSLVSCCFASQRVILFTFLFQRKGHHVISSGLWAHDASKAVAKARQCVFPSGGRWPNLPGSNALVWLAQVGTLASCWPPGKKSFLWMSQNHKCVLKLACTCPVLWKAESTNEGDTCILTGPIWISASVCRTPSSWHSPVEVKPSSSLNHIPS